MDWNDGQAASAGPQSFDIEMAVCEAGWARGLRHLATSSRELADVTCDDQHRTSRALRLSAAELLERMMVSTEEEVLLGTVLDRFAVHLAMASPRMSEMMTSLIDIPLAGQVSRALMAALCEFMFVAESAGDPTGDMKAFFASSIEQGNLVFALAVDGADGSPAPSASGARALCRAESLVRAIGGDMNRGFRDGMMIFGIMIAVKDLPNHSACR